MYAAAVEAQAIHQKLGARVWIGTDQNGHMQYAMSLADRAAWAQFDAAVAASKEWAAFEDKIAKDPTAARLRVIRVQQHGPAM
jgi:hypothetical protein